jgi:aryl-alcohol dehydrogenase-like predicted oxidoreductase
MMGAVEYRPLGKSGVQVSALGLGTWGIGGFYRPDRSKDDEAIKVIRLALESGMNLIDTAEMYGAGHAEELVGLAVSAQRDKAFIATKVSPEHFDYDGVIAACRNSLARLHTDYIDLYQLHWPNPAIPLRETMKAMERLAEDGLIRHIGVSNFSVQELEEARSCLSRWDVVSNQVEYSLLSRAIERELLPHCQKEGILVIAYSPLARGALLKGRALEVLRAIGAHYGKTPAQVALNWLLCKRGVVAIPKALDAHHLLENLGAVGWRLKPEHISQLERAFPPSS